MTSVSIPILTLRLFDIRIPAGAGDKQLLLTGAKDLLKAHPQHCEEAGVNLELFHNPDITYSGIQISTYRGIAEWTAIGQAAVEALECWYVLFRKTHPLELENVVEIRETYTPSFLPHHQRYQVDQFLISDDLARELNRMHDDFRAADRMERYLYGNLMTFFQHIDFVFDKEFYFLKIQVEELIPYDKALEVFHQQKKTAFRVRFCCNFRLPQTVRIGQSTALGFGRIRHLPRTKISRQRYDN